MKRRSALEMLKSGEAQIVSFADYPIPLRRFLKREERLLQIRLSASARRKLDKESRNAGIPADELARK